MRYKWLISFYVILSIVVLSARAFAEQAAAVIEPTVEGSLISGKVTFEETDGALKIIATWNHVPPGKHGFHIHEYGSCADQGQGAGGHYNPDHTQHGHLVTDGFPGAHAGDLGNIEIASNGSGKLETVIPKLTLTRGAYAIAGRSIILHEKEDDFTQPTGNAGGRIGCGIIAIAAGE